MNKENTNSFDILSTLATFSVAILLCGLFFGDFTNRQRKDDSASLSEVARSLTQKLQNSKAKPNRSIASQKENLNLFEGVQGKDSWGNAIHYKVLRDAFGRPTHLAVWSLGPNNFNDSDSALYLSPKADLENLFQKDDFGMLIRL